MESLKNLFPPKGRLRQRDYILWQLLFIGVMVLLFLLSFCSIPGLIFLIFIAYGFEFYITAKRIQDCSYSGLYSLLLFIPTINGLLVLVLCLYSGTKGTNEFGLDPREKVKKE